MQRFLRSILLPGFILVAAGVAVYLMFAAKPKAPVKPARNNAPLVETFQAQPQPHRPVITLFGRLESPQQSTLSATLSALVAEVPAREGDQVSQGELLVLLDERDVRLVLEQREAELRDLSAQILAEKQQQASNLQALKHEQKLTELAQASAQRYQQLSSNRLASDINRDEALQKVQAQELSLLQRQVLLDNHEHRLSQLQAQQQRMQALLNQAKLDLERTRILAPFNGRITAVQVSPGNLVRPGEVLVTLFNLDQIEVRAQIPSTKLNAVQQALAQGETLAGEFDLGYAQLPVRLDRLAGAVGNNRGGVDGLFQLSADLTNPQLGRTGELELQLPVVVNSFLIPPTALYDETRVYVVEQDQLRATPVRRIGSGKAAGGTTWPLIQAEIEAGAQILKTQLSNAISGLEVKPAAKQP